MVGQSPGELAGNLCGDAADPNWSCAATEKDRAAGAFLEAGATPCRMTTPHHPTKGLPWAAKELILAPPPKKKTVKNLLGVWAFRGP